MIGSTKYLVQIFESTYYGKQIVEERVVEGKSGIVAFLEEHSFIDRVIKKVLETNEYVSKYDLVHKLKRRWRV